LIETPGLDNVTLIGAPTLVPEPGALAMMTIGAVAIVAVAWYNRRHAVLPP
jgi:hypothetical protein